MSECCDFFHDLDPSVVFYLSTGKHTAWDEVCEVYNVWKTDGDLWVTDQLRSSLGR